MHLAPPLELESDLNPEQRAAVTHGDGPQLVLAGAGSGKTRVITYRVAWLIRKRDVPPPSVVAVTFTNKAAGEMSERVETLLGVTPLPTFVGTFHRFALVLLRRWGDRIGVPREFVIFDRDDQLAAVKRAIKDEGLDESAFAPRAVLAAISAAKNRLVGPEAFEGDARGFFERRVAPVYTRYQRTLRTSSAVDFDDMLRLSVALLESERPVRERLQGRIEHLLVDEFQDTNHAQMRMVHLLVGDAGNLTAVGDEDQGIYRWRGADLDNVLEFERYFPGAVVRKLERNYRSTQPILEAAGGLVEHNRKRRGKRLWTDRTAGEPPLLYRARDEQDEARWAVATLRQLDSVPLEETAILVRTNAQTRAFEEELLRRQVPYQLVAGVRFYDRAEIKDLVAYLRLVHTPHDNVSLLRILNQPPRGIGKSTREGLIGRARDFGGSLWETLRHVETTGFPARSEKALIGFRSLVEGLRAAAAELPLPALLDRLLAVTDTLGLEGREDEESLARVENIRELLSAAQEFTEAQPATEEGASGLTPFLDHVALVSDLDGWNAGRGVSLMTLHSAKGLEFEAVAVTGLEDGLLPHANAQGEAEDLEEERRLLYVGMTRARSRLWLTTCRRRRIAGRYQDRRESPFLAEIPADAYAIEESPELFYDGRTRAAYDFFGRSRPARTSAAPTQRDGLAVGGRVRHSTLGDGVVLELEGAGDELKVTVFFNRAGKKKILARYANLERL